MGWTYRIISPSEAAPLQANPGEYLPQTALGRYRAIFEWITSRTIEWRPRDADHFCVSLGDESYAVLQLITHRWQQMSTAAGASFDEWQRAKSTYVPKDDDAVVEIEVDGRGQGGSDITLIAQWADWLNAAVFDCQRDEMLTPQQWLQRDGPKK